MKTLWTLIGLTAFACSFVAVGYAAAEDAQIQPSSPRFKLPETILPLKYYLTLNPNFGDDAPPAQKYTTDGFVRINVQAVVNTNQIILHARNIDIEYAYDISVRSADNFISLGLFIYVFDRETETLSLNLVRQMQAGQEYIIEISFISRISTDASQGLYLTTYEDPNTGIQKEMVSTWMQPNHARSVFPCFDEPHLTANFTAMIRHYYVSGDTKSTKAIGNMKDNGKPILVGPYRFVTFEETPPISTHLLSFAIVPEDFQMVTNATSDGTEITVHGPPSGWHPKAADLSLKYATESYAHFKNYLPLSLNWHKFDLLALPNHKMQVMQSPGLQIYSPEIIFFKEGEQPETARLQTVSTMAREMARQWFGNTLTPGSSSHAWVTEAISTYLQHQALTAIAPEYDASAIFFNSITQYSLSTDVGSGSQHILDIAEGDSVSTAKSTALLGMVRNLIGEEKLTNGISNFLMFNKNTPVETDDFWNAVGHEKLSNGLSIKDTMQPWLTQSGFPLVRVQRTGANNLMLTQEKFSPNDGNSPGSESSDNDAPSWHLPVSAISASKPEVISPVDWIPAASLLKQVTVDGAQANDWIVVNPEHAGYYRVMYDPASFELIRAQLNTNHSVFTPKTRSQLLGDHFVLAENHLIPVEQAIALTAYLGKETSRVVWNRVIPYFQHLLLQVSTEAAARQSLITYIQPKIDQVITALNWNPIDLSANGDKQLLLTQLFNFASHINDTPRLDFAQSQLTQYLANPANKTLYSPVLHHIGICAASKASESVTAWNTLEKNISAHSWLDYVRIPALACSEDVAVLNNLLRMTSDHSSFYAANIDAVLHSVALNSAGWRAAYDHVADLLTDSPMDFAQQFVNVVETISSYVKDLQFVTEVEEFVAENSELESNVEYVASITSSLNRIKRNAKYWLTLRQPALNWIAAAGRN